MALPTTGPISLNLVNQELRNPSGWRLSLNDPEVRQLAGKPSGQISMSDLRGKSREKVIVIENDSYSVDLRSLHNQYYSSVSPGDIVRFVVNNGVYIGSSSDFSLRTGTWDSSVTLILVNNGFIYGRGGRGGVAVFEGDTDAGDGEPGGTALLLNHNITIDNTNGVIAGGGGGGGAVRIFFPPYGANSLTAGGGGGAGISGGQGGVSYTTGDSVIVSTPASGGKDIGGSGGVSSYSTVRATGGRGGDVGYSGSTGSIEGGDFSLFHEGGPSGASIVRSGRNITWIGGNTSERVKGPII